MFIIRNVSRASFVARTHDKKWITSHLMETFVAGLDVSDATTGLIFNNRDASSSSA
jgi:hypothetical protein